MRETNSLSSGWKTERLGRLCERSGGSIQTGPFGSQLHAEDYKDVGTPIITVEHLKDGRISHRNLPLVGAEDVQRLSRYLLKTGDLVFSRVGAIDRCAYTSETEDGWLFSGRCLRVRSGTNDIVPRFLGYLLNSWKQRRWILNHSVGSTMACLNTSILSNLPIEFPSERQQQRIVEILSTVDEAIEQTEALIAKTRQIKAGLMHDLFTRGVTPDGKLRPPRDEAPQLYKESPLGWIPKEWDLKQCSDICLSVIDCKNRTPPGTEDGHPVIRTPNVRDGEFVWADLAYTDPLSYIEWTARGRPVPGDVVITREAPVGEVCMIPDDLGSPCLGQRMMLYRPDPNVVLGDFLVHVLQSPKVQKHLDVISGGSTVGHVRVGDIRNLRVPWTAMPEQEVIAANLGGTREQLLSLRAEATKLQQAKAGLMHDLLTGRVRVSAPMDRSKSQ